MKITLILYPISLPEVIVTPYFIFLEMLDTKPTLYTVYLIVQIFFFFFSLIVFHLHRALFPSCYQCTVPLIMF